MAIAANSDLQRFVDLMVSLSVFEKLSNPDTEYVALDKLPEYALYIGCPDGKQLLDKISAHQTKLGQKPHPIAMPHGGNSALHPDSPLNGPIKAPLDYILQEAVKGVGAKCTRVIAHYCHMPCGWQKAHGATNAQMIELSLAGMAYFRDYAVRHNEPFCHIPYCQVDLEAGKRTYRVSQKAWIRARMQFREELVQLPCGLTAIE